MSELDYIDDELLSAYLDDELSLEERARVEARLASDSRSRHLLEQLQAASHAMQSLPQEAVGVDLRESILRHAEAAMLSSKSGESATAFKPAAVNLRNSLPRITVGQTRRGWIWAGLAIAAGLLIMVFQPGHQNDNGNLGDVASTRRGAEPNREGSDRAVRGERDRVPELHSMELAERQTVTPPAAAVDSFGSAPPASKVGSSSAAGIAAPPAPGAFDMARSPAAAPAAPAPVTLNDELAPNAKDDTAASQTLTRDDAGSGVELPSQRAGGAPADAPMSTMGVAITNAPVANGSAPSVAVNEPAAAANSRIDRRFAETAPQGAVGGERAPSRQLTEDELKVKARAESTREQLLVVRVAMAPEALRNKAFDRLLVKHGVGWEGPTAQAAEPTPTARKALEESKTNLSREEPPARGTLRDQNGQSPIEDAILVAAPMKTIEQCLADLKRDQANFPGLEIESRAPPTQNRDDADKSVVDTEAISWSKLATDLGARFNRGRVSPRDANRDYAYESYGVASQDGPAAGRRSVDGGFGGGTGLGAQKQAPEQTSERGQGMAVDAMEQVKEQLAEGRARRIRTWYFDDALRDKAAVRRGSAPEESRPASVHLGVESEVEAQAKAAGLPNVRVLFLLRPEIQRPAATTPPSPPAENSAK